MLPSWFNGLWRDRLHFVLSPDKVAVVRYARGLQSQITLSKSLDCAELQAGQPLWQPALRAMQKLLAEAGGNADATVTLSSHFVRYALVPAQADLADEVEEEAYVRFCFSEVFGTANAAQWTFRWAGALAVDQQIASAIDTALLTALDEAIGDTDVNLRSVQPYLMSVFNLVRVQMKAAQQWLVLVEPGSANLCAFADGECTSLRTVRLDENWQTALPRLLAREFLIADTGNTTKDLLICAPQRIDLGALQLKGWNVRALGINASSLLQGKFTPVGVTGATNARA